MEFNYIKLLKSIYCQDKCQGGGKCECPYMFRGSTCSEVVKNPTEYDQKIL